MVVIKRLTVFRAAMSEHPEARAWRLHFDQDPSVSWRIVNPSGCPLADRAYEGMGMVQVITPEQAQDEKRTALVNCARYTARLQAKDGGEIVPETAQVVIR